MSSSNHHEPVVAPNPTTEARRLARTGTTLLVSAGLVVLGMSAVGLRADQRAQMAERQVFATTQPPDRTESGLRPSSLLLLGLVAVGGLGALLHRCIIRRARDAYRRAELGDRRLADGLDGVSDGVALWDRHGRLVHCNERFFEVLSIPPGIVAKAMGRAELLIVIARHGLPSSTHDQHAAWLQQRLHDRADGVEETFELRPNGRIILATERRSSEGGIVATFRDVTLQRRMEQELQRMQSAEREVNEQQHRFVTIVGHEFRTPLALIDSAAQILEAARKGGPAPGVEPRLQRIRGAVRRMSDLIDRTLATARLEQGFIKPEPVRFDLCELLGQVCERTRSANPAFQIELTASPTEFEIEGDRKLIEQAVVNLLSNAVKFSGRSTRVAVDIRRGRDCAVIKVVDSGVGVPTNEIPKLFAPYFRASTSAGTTGAGLGLYLAREFATLHGGDIAVESRLGSGSTFSMRLPVRFIRAAVDREAA